MGMKMERCHTVTVTLWHGKWKLIWKWKGVSQVGRSGNRGKRWSKLPPCGRYERGRLWCDLHLTSEHPHQLCIFINISISISISLSISISISIRSASTSASASASTLASSSAPSTASALTLTSRSVRYNHQASTLVRRPTHWGPVRTP